MLSSSRIGTSFESAVSHAQSTEGRFPAAFADGNPQFTHRTTSAYPTLESAQPATCNHMSMSRYGSEQVCGDGPIVDSASISSALNRMQSKKVLVLDEFRKPIYSTSPADTTLQRMMMLRPRVTNANAATAASFLGDVELPEKVKAATDNFCADTIVYESAKVPNNIWLRLHNIATDLASVDVKCNIDFVNHVIRFSYKDENGAEKFLFGSELLPNEEDLLSNLLDSAHLVGNNSIDVKSVLSKIHDVFNSQYAVRPLGAEDGVEIYLFKHKEYFVYRNSAGVIETMLLRPTTEIINGPAGYSKRITARSDDAVELRRTPDAIKNNRMRQDRRPSLTTLEMSDIHPHNVRFYKLGVGHEGDEVWISALGSFLTKLDYASFGALASLASDLDDIHSKHSAHCDIKPANVLLAPKPRVFLSMNELNRRKRVIQSYDLDQYGATPSSLNQFSHADVVVGLSRVPTSTGQMQLPKVYIRTVSGEFQEILQSRFAAYTGLGPALQNIANNRDSSRTQGMLDDLGWRFIRFFVTCGLPPKDQFRARLMDNWRAVKPRPITDTQIDLNTRYQMALQSLEECFGAITPEFTVFSLYGECENRKRDVALMQRMVAAAVERPQDSVENIIATTLAKLQMEKVAADGVLSLAQFRCERSDARRARGVINTSEDQAAEEKLKVAERKVKELNNLLAACNRGDGADTVFQHIRTTSRTGDLVDFLKNEVIKKALEGIKLAQVGDMFALHLSGLDCLGFDLHHKLASIDEHLEWGLPLEWLSYLVNGSADEVGTEIIGYFDRLSTAMIAKHFSTSESADRQTLALRIYCSRQLKLFNDFMREIVRAEILPNGVIPQEFFYSFMRDPFSILEIAIEQNLELPRMRDIWNVERLMRAPNVID